jgi:hypothetical protein
MGTAQVMYYRRCIVMQDGAAVALDYELLAPGQVGMPPAAAVMHAISDHAVVAVLRCSSTGTEGLTLFSGRRICQRMHPFCCCCQA